MSQGKIDDVYVIADSGPVPGGVVISKHTQLLQFARGHLGDIGHEVVGNTGRVLAYSTRLVRSDRVEVSHEHRVEILQQTANQH